MELDVSFILNFQNQIDHRSGLHEYRVLITEWQQDNIQVIHAYIVPNV